MFMFIKKMWNKIICDHKWFLLGNGMFYVPERPTDMKMEERSFLYCPKCDKRKIMTTKEWNRIEMAKKVKEEYERIGGTE